MSNISEKPLTVLPGPESGKSEMESGRERRRVPRYPFTAAADIVDIRSQTRVAGRTSDLGLGGCYIDVFSPFPVSSLVRVRLVHEKRAFEATATVLYAQVSMGMGLAFTEIKPEHQTILQAWLDELSGDLLPKPDVVAGGSESGLLAAVLNLQQVLNELINLMVRKKVINESEGSALLRDIFR